MTNVSELESELAEARESYLLANARIVELLDEKMLLERERDEATAALGMALKAATGFQSLVHKMDSFLDTVLADLKELTDIQRGRI